MEIKKVIVKKETLIKFITDIVIQEIKIISLEQHGGIEISNFDEMEINNRVKNYINQNIKSE